LGELIYGGWGRGAGAQRRRNGPERPLVAGTARLSPPHLRAKRRGGGGAARSAV